MVEMLAFTLSDTRDDEIKAFRASWDFVYDDGDYMHSLVTGVNLPLKGLVDDEVCKHITQIEYGVRSTTTLPSVQTEQLKRYWCTQGSALIIRHPDY